MSDVKDMASLYFSRNFKLVPIGFKTKIPIKSGWQTNPIDTLEEIESYLEKNNNELNLGIVTGQVSGIWCLDIDTEGGKNLLNDLYKENGAEFDTLMQETGGGGLQLFFSYDERISRNRVKILPGIDIRSDAGQCLVYPSIHPNGNQYRWINYSNKIKPAPEFLIEKLLEEIKRDDEPIDVAKHSQIGKGERNETLFKLASNYRHYGYEEDEILGFLNVINETRCNPPVTSSELRIIANSAIKYQPEIDIIEELSETPIEEVKKGHEKLDWHRLVEINQERGNQAFIESLNREGDLLGFKLGNEFSQLEESVAGWGKGLNILLASPNVGKTNLILNLSRRIIENNPEARCIYFTLDDSFSTIYQRVMAMVSDKFTINEVSNLRLLKQKGRITDKGIEELKKKTDSIMERLILIDDDMTVKSDEIERIVREVHKEHSSLAVFIDFFNKISHNKFEQKHLDMEDLGNKLKLLSNQLDIPILVTVETNKKNGRELSNDLIKGTSSLEFQASCIFLLSNSDDSYLVKGTEYPILKLKISKNKRSHHKGVTIPMVMYPAYVRYIELKKAEKGQPLISTYEEEPF